MDAGKLNSGDLDAHRKIVPDEPDVRVPKLGQQDNELLNQQSGFNRSLLEASGKCGCFHCGRKFPVSLIANWMKEPGEEDTGVCPYCGVDALVVGTSKYPLTTALLAILYEKWFEDEQNEQKKDANQAPMFADLDSYYREGAPFQWNLFANMLSLGQMGVWSISDPGTFQFDEEGAEFPGVYTQVPLEGMWRVRVRKGRLTDDLSDEELWAMSEKEFENRLNGEQHYRIERDEISLCLTPWGGSDELRLESLAQEYGDRLMAVFKDGDFWTVRLYATRSCN